MEVRIVGHVGRDQRPLELELGVGEQHRELGRGEADAGGVAFLEHLVRRQRLQRAIEARGLLEPLHLASVHAHEQRRLDRGDLERVRLGLVVGQHEVGDRVGHVHEERVAVGPLAAVRARSRAAAGS